MTTKSADNDRSGNVRRLSDAVRRIRIAEAERADAFADLFEADRARLSLVSEELAGVFAELPEDDYFLCEIAGGSPPRLWIDPTSHVVMARDRRTYRFLKDTRLGRVVLFENTDPQAVADVVTDYIAERIVERDRAQESDFLIARLRQAALPSRVEPLPPAAPRPRPEEGARRGAQLALKAVLFLAGFAAGALGLIAYAWFMVGN